MSPNPCWSGINCSSSIAGASVRPTCVPRIGSSPACARYSCARARVLRSAIVLKPSTLLHLQSVLRKRKYRMLFSPRRRRRPGPKGPNPGLIEAVVAMKRRNPGWGCPRIAQQISLAFGVEIDKDVVRRVLSVHYRPESDSGGPSWLTFLGHTKDSLWSCDLFRCESATLRTHWALVVMDQFTRRIIGFGVHSGIIDGVALCRMFHRAIRGHSLPKYLSSDHDPLYRFHQWEANLRILEVTEIKTVPLRTAFAPLHRATYRRDSPRVSRPHPILGHSRSGSEANRFSTLLQVRFIMPIWLCR